MKRMLQKRKDIKIIYIYTQNVRTEVRILVYNSFISNIYIFL